MPGIQCTILSITQMILTLGNKKLKVRLLEKNLYYAEAIFLKPRRVQQTPVNANTTTLLEGDEDSDLDEPSYAGMPGLEPRDTDSSNDNSNDSMPVLLTRSNHGWNSSDDDLIHQMMTVMMMMSMFCQRAISMTLK